MKIKNNDDQHSNGKKIVAALTTIVGAATIHNMKNSKVFTKELPRITKFAKVLSEDIADKKLRNFDAKGIKDFTEKHILNDNSTWKRLGRELNNKESLNKLEIDLKNNNAISSLIRLKEVENNPGQILGKLFNTKYADESVNELVKEGYEDITEDTIERAKQFVTETLEKNNLIEYIDKVNGKNVAVINKDFVNKFIEKDEEREFFTDLINNFLLDEDRIGIEENIQNQKDIFIKNNFGLIMDIKEKYTGKTMQEVYGYKGEKSNSLLDKITTTNENSFFNRLISTIKNQEEDIDGLTLGEYIDDIRFSNQTIAISNANLKEKVETINVQETIKKIVEEIEEKDKNSSIRDVYINKEILKINREKDLIIDGQEIDKIKNDFDRSFAGSIIGKILKTTDKLNKEEANTITYFSKNKINPLAQDEDIIQVLNKYYSIDKKNRLKYETKYDDMYTISSKHGTISRMTKKMFGIEKEYRPKNRLFSWLDFDIAGEPTLVEKKSKNDGISGKIARNITETLKYNIIDKVIYETSSDPIEYYNNLKNLNKIFSTITDAPNNKTIEKMKKVIHTNNKDNITMKILDAISNDNIEDILKELSSINTKKIHSRDLISLIKKGTGNRESAKKMLSIEADKLTDVKKVMKYKDLLKREAYKEVLIREINEGSKDIKNFNELMSRVKQAGIKGKEYKNTMNLIHWTTLQDLADLYNIDNGEQKGIENIINSNKKIIELINIKRQEGTIPKDAWYIESFKDTLISIKNDYKELSNKSTERKNKIVKKSERSMNDSIMVRKSYTPREFIMDMLNDMNNYQKQKANLKKFGMQFVAGRNSREYVTAATFAPYFLTQRLIDPFADFGLSFSNNNTKSVGDLWKNITLKRILPLVLGITAFNYLDYETRNITGTGIKGAFVQGVANVDLGLRKVADITKIGNLLEIDRKINPITQYLFGDDYQNSKERKEYYEDGYSPVRKGRWWAFGSASEYRGGKISYFQPNIVKRVNSNWKIIGIYGDEKEKWKHSWIPTPTHPLSPIRNLMDPYWLERKTYEERPYMVTSPLFSSSTPWGVILNSTIGQRIKPIRRMHKEERIANLIDPRTLIQERNERIKEKAINKNKNNLIRISQDGLENIEYIPNALADKEKVIQNININNDSVNIEYDGIDYINNVQGITENEINYNYHNDDYNNGNNNYNNNNNLSETYNKPFKDYSNKEEDIFDKLKTKSITFDLIEELKNNSVMNNIQSVNESIKQRAKQNGVIINKSNLYQNSFNVAKNKINNKYDYADLLNTKSRYDYVNDLIYSGKELGGMYGFLSDVVGGKKGRRVREESAEKISSFKRTFWDSNIGGLGGEVLEIARRFFPHDDHSWTEINNIRNKMPEWMPERFKTGDPYTKIQKGEMRLPGKGYETLNKLHPDKYGKYGALDRMKILGDVAPWSDEYKIWRQISEDLITDEKGKKEIEKIKDRVEKQSKKHEFYNYKFSKNPTVFNKEIIKNINGTAITTVSGNIYNLAGLKNIKNNNVIKEELSPGTRINVEYLKSDKNVLNKSAIIYLDGENLNKKIVDMKMAEENTNTSIDAKAMSGHTARLLGQIEETIAHLPIPYIHNKLLKIDDPLESYRNDELYGAQFATWEHPIEGFVKPSFQKAWGRDGIGQGIAIGAWATAEYMWKNSEKLSKKISKLGLEISDTGVNKLASIIMNVGNPGAFTGSMISSIPVGLFGNEGIRALLSSATFTSGVKPGILRNSSRVGAAIMLAGYGATRSDKPIQATTSFALAGAALAKQLKIENFSTKQGLAAGAITGLMISGVRSKILSRNDDSFDSYKPDNVKKKWDIEEYFDRLEYIKYMGLYEKAARKAQKEEKVNVRKIVYENDKIRENNEKQIKDMKNILSDLSSNNNIGSETKMSLYEKINQKIKDIKTSETIVRGGKYTKAAIAYKEAADSTIYALNSYSSQEQILRALPKNEREYFIEFSKETNKNKQKEILKNVSPQLKKALKIAWGYENIPKEESNERYFKTHFMPGTFWAGWSPQVDLSNVKIKTIKNEGMALSDFGIYESQESEPAAILSPNIKNYDNNNSTAVGLKAKLISALNGYGLIGVKVSVDSTPDNVIDIAANIMDSTKIAEYKIRKGINEIIGTRMFYE